MPSFLLTARSFSRLNIFTYDSSKMRAGLFNRVQVDFKGSGAAAAAQKSDENRLAYPLTGNKFDMDDRTSSWRGASNYERATVFRYPYWDGAAVVSVPLQGRIGDEVVLELTPSDDWILLSEVQFVSGMCSKSISLKRGNKCSELHQSLILEPHMPDSPPLDYEGINQGENDFEQEVDPLPKRFDDVGAFTTTREISHGTSVRKLYLLNLRSE